MKITDMKMTRIPKRFHQDADECECYPPAIIKEKSNYVWVSTERNKELEDFVQRCIYYAGEWGPARGQKEWVGLKMSARATLRAFKRDGVLTEKEERQIAGECGI